jgi:hypothetical protein
MEPRVQLARSLPDTCSLVHTEGWVLVQDRTPCRHRQAVVARVIAPSEQRCAFGLKCGQALFTHELPGG